MVQTNEHSSKTIDELRGALAGVEAEIANTNKVLGAVEWAFREPTNGFVRAVRAMMVSRYGPSEALSLSHITSAMKRLCVGISEGDPAEMEPRATRIYTEEDRIGGKPEEVIDLFRSFDTFCNTLSEEDVKRNHRLTYTSYQYGDSPFCSVHLRNDGLRISLKLPRTTLVDPPDFVRDVSEIRHCGIGDTELRIISQEQLDASFTLIRDAFLRAGEEG